MLLARADEVIDHAAETTDAADQPDRRIFSGRRRDEFELTKMR